MVKISILPLEASPTTDDIIPIVDLASNTTKKTPLSSIVLTRAGMTIQTVSTDFAAVASGTTVFPLDDTIPQNGEGTEFMTQAITPSNVNNILIIEAVIFASSGTASRHIVCALFQDATAGALAATDTVASAANDIMTIPIAHSMVAGTTSSTTFKIRIGAGTNASTITFNGQSATRLFGAITKSFIKITEVVV